MAGVRLPDSLRVVVTQGGEPVAGVTVTWFTTEGTRNPATVPTGPDGTAATTWTPLPLFAEQFASARLRPSRERWPTGRNGTSSGSPRRESVTITAQIRQESIGGRFEPDGDFRGTIWLITGPEPVDEEALRWELIPREPTKGEVDALRRLVAEIVRRRIDP
jgi:hypothetical protein